MKQWGRVPAVVVLSLSISSVGYGATRGTLNKDCAVFAQPDRGGKTLGYYRKGASVSVNLPDSDGWYAILFSKPVKGSNQGWVQKENVDVAEVAQTSGSGQSNRKILKARPKSGDGAGALTGTVWVGVAIDSVMASPTAFLTAVGEHSTSASGLHYGVEVGFQLSPKMAIAPRLGLFSFSKAFSTGGSTVALTAKGYEGVINGEYNFGHGPLELIGAAGLGAAVATAGNTTATSVISTSSIVGTTFLAKFIAGYRMSSFAVRFEAGYQVFTLSQVPLLLANDTQSAADLKLGGLFGGLGVFIYF